MADHRQRAESILAALTETYGRAPNGKLWDRSLAHDRPALAAQMAIAYALLALGDQMAHDWEEEPDA